ncbi:MAG: iron-containing alcohol dehydrogenase [Dehalococcoidia bacterium]|nr:iron-containing alcohol dehydrogenase [Dehalococcoidia bacterium]
MATTIFHTPIKLLFGEGTVEKVGEEAARLGKKALVVIGGSSARKSGLLDKIIADLKTNGVESVVFDGITPNPRSSTVDEGARIAASNNVDLIIGVGGGSVMDASKAIKLAYSGGRPVFEYYTGASDPKAVKPKAELILVCTMAATGSEFNNGAVITNWDTHEKRFIGVPIYYPAVSIVDPALTLSMPVGQLAKGGVDIFLHVVENYITQGDGAPMADALREALMKVVVEWLPPSVKEPTNLLARTNLSWAATLACSQIITLGGGAGYRPIHLMEHPVSGYLDVAHGDGLSALLPAWLRQSMPLRGDRIAKVGKNVFGVDSDPVGAVDRWLESVGMKITLKQLGVTEDKFEIMAKAALETSRGLLAKDPIHNSVESIVGLYRAAY